jgi:hypothetical protein
MKTFLISLMLTLLASSSAFVPFSRLNFLCALGSSASMPGTSC